MKPQENCTEIREERQNIISADEARQNGKMIRQTCKRRSHGNWEYTKDRDHIIELLKEQERTRIQELIPIRHERMSASPFAFYRGAAIIMADDAPEYKVFKNSEPYTEPIYDVVCPVCGEEITIDEDIRKEGSIKCPGCGELLEFEDTEE